MIRKTRIAKTVAGIAGMSMAFSAAFPVAAVTTAELQAQIAALMAQLAAMQGGASACASFSQDLTVGSTGPQVVALQQMLVAQGHLSMPAGVAYGYFGSLTKAAVARWQAANGVAPAVGYFGPISRARANVCASGTTTGGTTTGTTGGTTVGGSVTLQGGEGSLVSFSQLGDIEADVDEGDNNAKVLGVEFEADDSDLAVQRVDVDFTLAGTGSAILSNYIDSVSLWMDGTKIASMDVDEASESSNVYSFRFSGLNGVVRENATAKLYVSVDAVSNVDSGDVAKNITVTIPVDGIRAVDAAGISDTYHTALFDDVFNVTEAAAGDLSLTEASSNPDLADVQVDDTAETSNVAILAFELEADETNIDVDDIRVNLVVSTSSVSAVVRSVTLYDGSSALETKTITSTTSADSYVVFDDLNLNINDGSTKTFTVKANINDTEAGASGTGFYSGTTLTASTTASATYIVAEDANGDTVTATGGTVTGGVLTLRDEGINTTPGSTSAVVTSMNTASDSFGTYTINFTVAAFGDDAYIYNGAASTSVSATVGVVYDITGTTWPSTTSTESSVITSAAEMSGSYFKVPEGQSKSFTLTVTLNPGTAGTYGLELEAIGFNDTADTADQTYTLDPNDQRYETNAAYIPN